MIGIFDSGFGGLSVLREILKLLPGEQYVYYADSAHCPYGEKSAEYITDRARFITQLLVDKGADLITIACNTATAAAIRTLRAEWPEMPFVGMEPAVKPAALNTRSGVIGVLATAGTLKGGNYLDLRDRYSEQVKVVEHVGQGFVELVERGILDGPQVEQCVRQAVNPLLAAGADTIVLGCTHYPFLEPVIKRIAGDNVEIINPAPAVARQVERILSGKIPPSAQEYRNQDNRDHSGQTSLTGIEVLSSGPAIPDEIIGRFLQYR